ncbi:alpha/beta hydrolase family protein [Thalassospira lucentensis]|uniref:alpha/beta hydrolase family protein n=1 Tax=Thalassospira lucentensis TaxID=168935 RepID=UPI003AA7B29E
MIRLLILGNCRFGFATMVRFACTAAFFCFALTPYIVKADTGQKVVVPALSYPVSGLRQRLLAEGKAIPAVDDTLQADIPARFFAPSPSTRSPDTPYAAVVALPDCDDAFPQKWITILQDAGIGVLVISPYQAHPSQSYCTGGSLDKPKHGVTYWGFDALSALSYLAHKPEIDPKRIAIFGYGYGAAAAQFAIYRHGHAKRIPERYRALVGLRPQCMSEMDNFVPSLLVAVRHDRFNPPEWCQWRMDRDIGPNTETVAFQLVDSSEMPEKQATRKTLMVEESPPVVTTILNFLSEHAIDGKNSKN